MYTRGVLISADTHSAKEIEFREENIREIIGCDCVGAFVSRVKEGSRKQYLVFHDDMFLFNSNVVTGWDGRFNEELRGNIIITREKMTNEDVEEVLRNVFDGVYIYRHV